jgi:hypothetical protein
LPEFGSDLSAYSGRINFIIKTGIEYGAELVRKQSRTHYWESIARGIGSIASGAGNFVGAFRPGANIYRNDYGPRNTTIYNGPVHFRPHYHILLFTNSKEVSKVLRYCHDKI